jgi:peptidoglycan/LPS O-acetylase OafA/YrhL
MVDATMAEPVISAPPPARRRHLDHVDAMRPIKQLGVLSTHSLLFFAPATAAVGAALMLLHVSREGFFFISACLLTYRYYDLSRHDLLRFWRRRLIAVALPYSCWTVIYFAVGLRGFHGSIPSALGRFALLLLTGYSQLYFLVVLMEFYVLFPAVVWLLKRTARHHLALLMTSLVIQLLYTVAVHWNWFPNDLEGTTATRLVVSYQLYLLAGAVAAVHYEAVHRWLVSHVRLIVVMTIGTALFAELWYWLAVRPGFGFLGAPTDPFQPVVIPFNLCAIALIYVAGVSLVRPRHATTQRLTHLASDNSYAVYLSQVLFLDALAGLGWQHLDGIGPWPFVVMAAVAVVFVAGCLLGGTLARTPFALALAGRHRVARTPRIEPAPHTPPPIACTAARSPFAAAPTAGEESMLVAALAQAPDAGPSSPS